MCYEYFVIGFLDYLVCILYVNVLDVEGYRDYIICNIGCDFECKVLKNAIVFVIKRREDSYFFYDFDN